MNSIENETNLEVNNYYYHSVGGFNLDKLVSILALGILSKWKGLKFGVDIQSNGLGTNGYTYVSVSNQINADTYSGTHLGVIIDHRGLHFFPRPVSNCPFELQIYGRVPKENIIGITIPPAYVKENFSDIQTFYILPKEELKIGMNSLEKFYLKNLNISLLADEKLQRTYNNALTLKDKKKEIYENLPILEAMEKADALQMKMQTDFNSALIERIKEVYKKVFEDKPYNLIDLIRYHTDLPIYFTTGELVTPLTIEKMQMAAKNSQTLSRLYEINFIVRSLLLKINVLQYVDLFDATPDIQLRVKDWLWTEYIFV